MMQNKFQILIWLAIICCTLSCAKDELPDDIVGSPIFQSEFSFDGNTQQLVAGVAGLSMTVETNIEADTVVFKSALATANCENCGPALFLQLSPSELASEWGNEIFESKLTDWEYAFTQFSESDTALSIFASSIDSPGIWSLNGAPQSTEPLTAFQFDIENNGNYEIKFENNNPGCGEASEQNISFNGELPCYANLYRGSGNDMNLFTVELGGGFDQNDLTFVWTYGDTTATTFVPSYLAPNLQQISEMCLEIIEPGSCSHTVCINLAATPLSCVSNFIIDSISLNTTSSPNESALFKITYIDENNNAYTSSTEPADQPSFTNIELLDISPYTDPGAPSRTFVKVRYQIHCLLYDTSGTGKEFNGIIESAFEDPGL